MKLTFNDGKVSFSMHGSSRFFMSLEKESTNGTKTVHISLNKTEASVLLAAVKTHLDKISK